MSPEYLWILLFSTCALSAQSGKGVSTPPPDPSGFLKEKKLALVVGINDYQVESSLGKLSFAVQDAQDLGNLVADVEEADCLRGVAI